MTTASTSLQEGFCFEYWLLHSVRSKLRSDLKKKKKKAASKIIQTKKMKFVNQLSASTSLFGVRVCVCACWEKSSDFTETRNCATQQNKAHMQRGLWRTIFFPFTQTTLRQPGHCSMHIVEHKNKQNALRYKSAAVTFSKHVLLTWFLASGCGHCCLSRFERRSKQGLRS